MKYIILLLLFAGLAFGTDAVKVEVTAVHAATHNDRGFAAFTEKALISHSPTRQVEVFNLDTIIDGEHVVLMCEDMQRCEAPAPGTYDAEIKKDRVRLHFALPVSQKQVARRYRIAGSW